VSPRYVVVTGADTGVGKTLVTAGLARACIEAGLRTVAIKPVESGCVGAAPASHEDGALLAAATGQPEPRAALVRLCDAVTPALAADREGLSIEMPALVKAIRELGAGADLVLIEGAGGLLSPLSWSLDLTHVAHDLDAGVLVVAADRLGAINHVHLTVQVLFDTWLPPLGVILSAPAAPDASTGTNADALRRRLSPFGDLVQHLFELERVEGVAAAAARLGPVVSWLGATNSIRGAP
jgi:dethiobiotin synthetase